MAKKIDARGYSCPQPVLMAKKALEKNTEGVEVLVDNIAACMNIKRYMEHESYSVNIEELDDDEYIVKGSR